EAATTEFSGVAATSGIRTDVAWRRGRSASVMQGTAEALIRPRPFGRGPSTIQRMMSFCAFGLIVALSDSAGGRDQLLANACMSRVNAGAYVATQGAQPGPVDVRRGVALRGGPVGGRLKRVTDIV